MPVSDCWRARGRKNRNRAVGITPFNIDSFCCPTIINRGNILTFGSHSASPEALWSVTVLSCWRSIDTVDSRLALSCCSMSHRVCHSICHVPIHTITFI